MQEPEWILEVTAHAIHDMQVAEHGGPEGVRDQGLLESALDHPKKLCQYKDSNIYALAAGYAYHLVNNYPFFDGNKRTAYAVARTFLIINGYDICVADEEKVRVFIAIAEKLISEEQLAQWYKANGQLA